MVDKPDETLPTGKYDTHGTPIPLRNFRHHVPTVEISLKRNGSRKSFGMRHVSAQSSSPQILSKEHKGIKFRLKLCSIRRVCKLRQILARETLKTRSS